MTDHPAAHLEPDVAELRTRATLAIAALALPILPRLWDLGARQYSIGLLAQVAEKEIAAELQARLERADALVNLGSVALLPATILAAIFFLRWVHRLVGLTHVLGGYLLWTPSQAVWAFFIPIISLFRPYQVLVQTLGALAPEKLREPAPRVDLAAQHDYRGAAFVGGWAGGRLPRALVGPWWTAYVVMNVGAQLSRLGVSKDAADVIASYHTAMAVDVIGIVAAALGMTVVRGLTARLSDRFRKVRGSTDEELASQGVELR